jgi:serine/threonine protein kinase
MGQVYEASHLRLGRHVALKVLNRAHSDDMELRQRFMREPVLAASIRHRTSFQSRMPTSTRVSSTL